jgi:hypothetical protein
MIKLIVNIVLSSNHSLWLYSKFTSISAVHKYTEKCGKNIVLQERWWERRGEGEGGGGKGQKWMRSKLPVKYDQIAEVGEEEDGWQPLLLSSSDGSSSRLSVL